MMRILFICLLLPFFHGMNVATYAFTKVDNTMHVTANVDVSDMLLALNKSNIESIHENDLEAYFERHFNYKINDQVVNFNLKSFKLEHNHVIINFSSKKVVGEINTLQVQNTALLEVNDKQSNIIEVRFDGMFRDFLTNKQQPNIDINF